MPIKKLTWDEATRKYREEAIARADYDIAQAERSRESVLKLAEKQAYDPVWGILDVYPKRLAVMLGRRAVEVVPCPPGVHFSIPPRHDAEEEVHPRGRLYVYSCENDRQAFVNRAYNRPDRWEVETGTSRSPHGFDYGWLGAKTPEQGKEAAVYWVEKGRYYWDDVLNVSDPRSPFYQPEQERLRAGLR